MSGAYVYVRRSLGAVEIRVWNKTSWFLKGQKKLFLLRKRELLLRRH